MSDLPLWTVQTHMYVFRSFGTFVIVEWSLDHSWDWLVYLGGGDVGVRFAGMNVTLDMFTSGCYCTAAGRNPVSPFGFVKAEGLLELIAR